MRRRHLPRCWLFTDERLGEALLGIVARLPRGTGIVFRNYAASDREQLGKAVAALARRRGLLLVVGGDERLARRLGAAGVHLMRGTGLAAGALTASARDRKDIVRARRAGAALVFVSPLFATRSHPGDRALGRIGFGRIAWRAGVRLGALGGMNAARFEALRPLGAYAWGGIDAFLPG